MKFFAQDFKNGNFELCYDLGSHIYFTSYTKSFPATSYRIVIPNIKEETKFSASLPVTITSQSTTQAISCAQLLTRSHFPFPVFACADFLCTSFSDKKQNETISEPFPDSPTSTHIKLMKSRYIYTQTLFTDRGKPVNKSVLIYNALLGISYTNTCAQEKEREKKVELSFKTHIHTILS